MIVSHANLSGWEGTPLRPIENLNRDLLIARKKKKFCSVDQKKSITARSALENFEPQKLKKILIA